MKLETFVPGDIAEVVVYFSEYLPNQVEWFKYDSVDGWEDYSQYATVNSDGRSVTLLLQDGAQGDSDGAVNGVIVDPGAIGTTSPWGTGGRRCFNPAAIYLLLLQ